MSAQSKSDAYRRHLEALEDRSDAQRAHIGNLDALVENLKAQRDERISGWWFGVWLAISFIVGFTVCGALFEAMVMTP